jgi:uncharacterized protein with GYD domain
VWGRFTDQGIRNIKETGKRAEAVRTMIKNAGGTVKDIFWILGQYDVVLIADAPDEKSMTALILNIGSLGNVRTQTLRAYKADEIEKILSK